MVAVCCICKIEWGTIVDVTYHRIPRNEDLKAKWFESIGSQVNKHRTVCSRHFHENDLYYKIVGGVVKRFLKPTAVPCLLMNKLNNNNTASKFREISRIDDSTADSIQYSANNTTDNKVHEFVDNSDKDVHCTLHDTTINTICVQHPSSTNSVQNNLEIDGFHNSVDNVEQKVSDDTHINTNNTNNCENDKFIKSSLKSIVQHPSSTNSVQNNLEIDGFHNSVDNVEQKVSDDTHIIPTINTKRFRNIRYIGDLRRNDFTSDQSWKIVKNFIDRSRKKTKVLHQTVNRLHKRVHFAPEMWEARSDKRKLKLNAIPTMFYLKKEKPMDIENITPESTENNTESYPIDAIQTVNDIKQESIDIIKEDPFFNDDQVINDAFESNVESASSTIQQVNDIKQEFIDTNEMDQSFNDDQMINDVSNIEFTSSTIYPASYTKCEENDEKRCKKLEDIIQRQHINMFKMQKKIKALRFIIHTLKKKYDNDKYKKALYSIFTKCQIEALFTKKRSIKFWSHETIVRALQLKFVCGTNGYEELIRQGIPLPSVRTLRRKLQNFFKLNLEF